MNVLCRLVEIIVMTLLGFMLLACSARRGEPIEGPLNLSDAKTRHGEILFMQHCYQCHPGGEAGLGPSLNEKPLPGPLIKLQVRKGLGAMPAFSEDHLTPDDLDDVVAYIKALRHHG